MIKIISPFVIVGNSAPANVPNDANQFERRLRGFLFDRPVSVELKDPTMPAKLRTEFASFLRGCNMGYHNCIRGFSSDFERHVPMDIRRDTREIIRATDETRQFLDSDLVSFDKCGIKSHRVIPLEVLVSEFARFKETIGLRGKHRLVDKLEIRSILEITRAKVMVRDAESKDDFRGYACYDTQWPYFRGLGYEFTPTNVLNWSTGRPLALVYGIELNWSSNPRVRFSTRDQYLEQGHEGRDSRSFFMRVVKKKRLDAIERLVDPGEYARVIASRREKEASLTYRRDSHGSVASFVASREKFAETPGSGVRDELGLTPTDYACIAELKNKIDLEAFTEQGLLIFLDRVDGRRWARFELYSCYQRMRLHGGSRVAPLLRFLKSLVKMACGIQCAR